MEWTEFYYDETSPSCLRWAVDVWTGFNKSKLHVAAHDVAGSAGTRRWRVKLKGKSIAVHQIVYELKVRKLSDDEIVDHIDGNPFNNLVGNLRAVTTTINNRNKRKMRNNTSGVTGVYFEEVNGSEYWMATYNSNGKRNKACFAVNKYGHDEAKAMAVAWRASKLPAAGYTERHGNE